jgi:hypothetical protein
MHLPQPFKPSDLLLIFPCFLLGYKVAKAIGKRKIIKIADSPVCIHAKGRIFKVFEVKLPRNR